jgi:hypothetical protein
VSGDHGAWSLYDAQALTLGTHTVTAMVTDYVGNTSALSAPFTVTIDQTVPGAPVIVGITPDTGASSTDGITSATNPSFFGTAAPGTLVTVYNGTHLLCSGTANASGNWTAAVTGGGLSGGTYSITATATEVAGNVSSLSQTYALTILPHIQNNTNITGISPDTGTSSNDGITNAQNIKISGTGAPNSSIQVFENGVAIGTTTSTSTGSWTYDNTKTTLPAGSYVFTAVATDLAGNVSQVSNTYNVLIKTHVNAPVISGAFTVTNGLGQQMLALEGTGEAQSQVQIYLGSNLLGTVNADGNGNWNWNSNLPKANGTYKFTAMATDVAGNASSTCAFNLQIGGSNAPQAQVQNLSGSNVVSNVNGNIVAINTPTLTGKATAGSVVTIVDGDVILGTAIANAVGNWTFTCLPLSQGKHNIAVEARNALGYTSLLSQVLTFNV